MPFSLMFWKFHWEKLLFESKLIVYLKLALKIEAVYVYLKDFDSLLFIKNFARVPPRGQSKSRFHQNDFFMVLFITIAIYLSFLILILLFIPIFLSSFLFSLLHTFTPVLYLKCLPMRMKNMLLGQHKSVHFF